MLSQILVGLSAIVILTLGLAHLLYTFWGPKLLPRDSALLAAMKAGSPVISRETTMWKAWVGFNASHSMGALLFGLIYAYLACFYRDTLFNSPFLLTVGFAMLGGLFVLAKRYWFSIPFRGIAFSLACYTAGVFAHWLA